MFHFKRSLKHPLLQCTECSPDIEKCNYPIIWTKECKALSDADSCGSLVDHLLGGRHHYHHAKLDVLIAQGCGTLKNIVSYFKVSICIHVNWEVKCNQCKVIWGGAGWGVAAGKDWEYPYLIKTTEITQPLH